MAEDNDALARRVTDRIRQWDDQAALEKQAEVDRTAFLKANGKVFWDQALETFKILVDKINEDLIGSPSSTPKMEYRRVHTSSREPETFEINKGEFPYVSFSTTLNLNALLLSYSLDMGSPTRSQTQMKERVDFKFIVTSSQSFSVSERNNAGPQFESGVDYAQYIVRKMIPER